MYFGPATGRMLCRIYSVARSSIDTRASPRRCAAKDSIFDYPHHPRCPLWATSWCFRSFRRTFRSSSPPPSPSSGKMSPRSTMKSCVLAAEPGSLKKGLKTDRLIESQNVRFFLLTSGHLISGHTQDTQKDDVANDEHHREIILILRPKDTSAETR